MRSEVRVEAVGRSGAVIADDGAFAVACDEEGLGLEVEQWWRIAADSYPLARSSSARIV